MCLNGTSSGRSTGFGVSSDLDVGVASMNSKSQTVLAEQFTPKTSPDSVIKGCGCFFFVTGLLALFVFIPSSGDGAALALCFGIPAVVTGFFIMKKFQNASPDQIKWEAKVKLYESGWICHKCGYTWMPSDTAKYGISSNDVLNTNMLNIIKQANNINVNQTETVKTTNIFQELQIDSQKRLRCPLCKSGVTMNDEELSAKQFKCSSCKSIIDFTPKPFAGNAWT
jgi:transposase-like protein